MIRTFDEWKSSLPEEFKEKLNGKPELNMINYIWLENLMNGDKKLSPNIDELLNWIVSEQVNAKRG